VTDDLTWKRTSPECFETSHNDRVWVLVKNTRTDGYQRPGWYLHAALSPSNLAGNGEWVGLRIVNVQYRAINVILSEEVKRQAAAIDRVRALAEQLKKDAAEDDSSKSDHINELIDKYGVYSGRDPEVLRLGALAEVQREIAQTIRRRIDGEVTGQ
jgi:hypothetical protein